MYALPEPEAKHLTERLLAAHAVGRASRDAEIEALRADVQTLLSHMDTFMRVSNDPAIYNLAKVVTERFAIQEKQNG